MPVTAEPPKKARRRPPLDAEDRAKLCRLVDFPALLRGYGIDVPNRRPMVCSIRPAERTPSCHLYPPGEGLLGHRGWTWKDYGTDEGGDALGYLVDHRGMDFIEAVKLLSAQTGFVPACLEGADLTKVPRPKAQAVPVPVAVQRPTMDVHRQAEAVAIYMDELMKVYPTADIEGEKYLQLRGVDSPSYKNYAFHQPKFIGLSGPDLVETPLLAALTEKHADLMIEAGLVKPSEDGKPMRLQWGAWAGDIVLIVHYDEEARPLSMIARRLEHKEGDELGKYLQQTYRRGAKRIPFGLLSLYRPQWFQWKPAPEHARELLIVEGPLDALGAAHLGWPALALNMRPQARGFTDQSSAAIKMLDDHMPALRDCVRIGVMPDKDADKAKAETGVVLAGKLAANLRAAGCRAEVLQLHELGFDLPDGCKDLADLAKSRRKQS
jgi:hypothetical protein